MDLLGLALMAAGAVAVVVGVLKIRGPLATIRRLDETEANLERYETWRGKRNAIEAEGPTGADEMRGQMRQRIRLWGIVAAVGVVMIIVGLLV